MMFLYRGNGILKLGKFYPQSIEKGKPTHTLDNSSLASKEPVYMLFRPSPILSRSWTPKGSLKYNFVMITIYLQ